MKKLSPYLAIPKVYLLEAETDFDTINTNTIDYTNKYSLGRAIEMNDYSRMSTTLDILDTTPSYRFAIRVKAPDAATTLSLMVEGESFNFIINPSMDVQWLISPPINLNRQTQITMRTNGNLTVDEMVVYSTERGDYLKDIFGPSPRNAKISFSKLSETNYNLNVEASEPFLMVFAESFEPNWKIMIDGRSIKDVLCDSYLNAFYIDEIGDYSTTMTYVPAGYARYGWMVTFITIILSIFIVIRED